MKEKLFVINRPKKIFGSHLETVAPLVGFFTIFGSKRSLTNISSILPSIVKVFWTNPFITHGCYRWHAQLRS